MTPKTAEQTAEPQVTKLLHVNLPRGMWAVNERGEAQRIEPFYIDRDGFAQPLF